MGISGTYFRTLSPTRTFPCWTSRSTAAPVNCFDTEASSNVVAPVIGVRFARFAIP